MDQFVISTPGHLLTGYGCQGDNNHFHGKTIFNNATTDAIWVENQVSFSAVGPIRAKTHLKSGFGIWLLQKSSKFMETMVSSMLMSLMMKIFSGVGAHHQNAHAEHTIETIMYMARTFMLHFSLPLSEYVVDDLALWSFAVKYAIRLYN